jgi:hypothetical protein
VGQCCYKPTVVEKVLLNKLRNKVSTSTSMRPTRAPGLNFILLLLLLLLLLPVTCFDLSGLSERGI